MQNLIDRPEHEERIEALNKRLWELLFDSNGHEIPLLEDRGPRFPWRHPVEAGQAEFPREYFRRNEHGKSE